MNMKNAVIARISSLIIGTACGKGKVKINILLGALQDKDFAKEIDQLTTLKTEQKNRELEKSMKKWCKGIVPSEAQVEEKILKDAQKYLGVNISKNPGVIAEYFVASKLKNIHLRKSNLSCDWIHGQEQIRPDFITEHYVIEIKSMKYYNGKGKRGGQGTASEKVYAIPVKYSGVYRKYGKKVIVIFCADMIYNTFASSLVDAFQSKEYHNNLIVKAIIENCRNFIYFCTYADLTPEIITKINSGTLF